MKMNNFVIDRVLRGMMTHSNTGEVLWSINQIENPSLTVNAGTADVVDAIGTPIMSFDRAKNAEFSAENSLFDLGLMAAQSGSSVVESSAVTKIDAPCFVELKVEDPATPIDLPHTPKGIGAEGIPFIYLLNGDGTLGQKYAYGAAAGEDVFTFSGKTITVPTGLKTGDRVFLIYDYEADGEDQACAVYNSASNFPRAGRFVMEVLGADVCNASTLYHAYVVFPQAKLLSDFDISFTTDSKHPFTLKAMQDYCDPEKRLFFISISQG